MALSWLDVDEKAWEIAGPSTPGVNVSIVKIKTATKARIAAYSEMAWPDLFLLDFLLNFLVSGLNIVSAYP